MTIEQSDQQSRHENMLALLDKVRDLITANGDEFVAVVVLCVKETSITGMSCGNAIDIMRGAHIGGPVYATHFAENLKETLTTNNSGIH